MESEKLCDEKEGGYLDYQQEPSNRKKCFENLLIKYYVNFIVLCDISTIRLIVTEINSECIR